MHFRTINTLENRHEHCIDSRLVGRTRGGRGGERSYPHADRPHQVDQSAAENSALQVERALRPAHPVRGERAGAAMRAARRVDPAIQARARRIILAVLLAEVWQPLRRRDYHALRSLSGVAPVTRRSGKTCVVVRRYACNKRLANALYHWARLATQHNALSRRRYAALRQRGHSHGRALRTVADRLLSVACTLLEQQTLFDPSYEVRDAAGA